MKRILIPLLCCLLAAWSCNVDSSFSTMNTQDMVTVSGGKLLNDNGVLYTLSQKAADTPALEEGKRYYIIFDILDKNYNVFVNTVIPAEIVVPTAASAEESITAHDPLVVQFNWIGPKYLDLSFSYFYKEGSDCAHAIFARYSLSDDKKTLNLSVYHDGNDENPATLDEKDLKHEVRIVSIPISDWSPSVVTLTLDVLSQNDEGKYTVERLTYSTK